MGYTRSIIASHTLFFWTCTINVDVAGMVVIVVVFCLHNPRLNMVFGAGFANLMANPLGGNNNNGHETNTAAACTPAAGGVAVTQTQGGSKDEVDYQQDFEEDHSGLNRQDQPTEVNKGD